MHGYSATSWWLEDPEAGTHEGGYALFRRAGRQPALTVRTHKVLAHDAALAAMREEIRHSCLLCGEHEDQRPEPATVGPRLYLRTPVGARGGRRATMVMESSPGMKAAS